MSNFANIARTFRWSGQDVIQTAFPENGRNCGWISVHQREIELPSRNVSKMNIRADERKYNKPEGFSTRKSHGNSPGACRIKFSVRISDGNTGRVKFTLVSRDRWDVFFVSQ